MEILGRSYIIQHCVASLKNKGYEKAYKIYVTDALKAITENTAKASANGGMTLSMRYADLISEEKPDERTEEDIINNLKAKMLRNKNGCNDPQSDINA